MGKNTIAKQEDLSEKYLSQIVLSLKTAGLVLSYRGAGGGYTLAKHPSKIKMSNVFKALEGDFEIVECCNDPLGCDRISLCATQNLWRMIGQSIKENLTDITLNDMVLQCRDKKQATVMYNI